jgi:SAM-dependent methyltransferase
MDYSLFADLYDLYVRSDLDVPFFLDQARQAGGNALELMSGTGRVSLPLLEAGVRLACVDASAEMLQALEAKARGRGLPVEAYQMDVRALDLGRTFDLIFIPFHAFAELHAEADQRQALAQARRHLSDQGRFIVTLHNPAVRLKRVDGQLRLWASVPLETRPGRLLVWGLETHDPEAALVSGMQFFEIYSGQGILEARRMVEFRFRVIERAAFEALAEAAGLRVARLYGDYAASPFAADTSPFMIFDLRKA